MAHILTPNEQYVCDLLIADPLYCSGEGHDPQDYMQPVAEFLKRNDISDVEKVRLADQLIRQFLGDIKNAVATEDERDRSLLAEAEADLHQSYRLGMTLTARGERVPA
ncbi:hypothetical protein LMG18090_04737 [Ralstonia mannitolilytica]|uniref:hypothetical protein n=1 Tax=Ralstonia mannitolilytica TaxID=105219 RepID=UPI0028F63074|nr:hypothetical protein [Ralstonia mannitolilytica]CAJ0805119.1 hypothetical protein LMG18090_04737 [Ralstonia mannitolilytica]